MVAFAVHQMLPRWHLHNVLLVTETMYVCSICHLKEEQDKGEATWNGLSILWDIMRCRNVLPVFFVSSSLCNFKTPNFCSLSQPLNPQVLAIIYFCSFQVPQSNKWVSYYLCAFVGSLILVVDSSIEKLEALVCYFVLKRGRERFTVKDIMWRRKWRNRGLKKVVETDAVDHAVCTVLFCAP